MFRAAICTLALAVCLFGAETPPVKVDKLLTPGAAGPFHIGMKVDDIKSRIRQEKIKLVYMDLEGFFSPAVVISSGLLAELIMNNRNEWVVASSTDAVHPHRGHPARHGHQSLRLEAADRTWLADPRRVLRRRLLAPSLGPVLPGSLMFQSAWQPR